MLVYKVFRVFKEYKEKEEKRAILEKKAIREIMEMQAKKVMLLPMLILLLPKYQNCKNQLLIKQ